MSRIEGFAPLLGTKPRVLVLGSVPSVASLEKQQYYGKAQNAFWRIMGELFSAGPELDYPQRCAILMDSGVAVWDVLASCVRPGSLDSAIEMRTAEVNDFASLFGGHPELHSVFFNGRKAEEIFLRRVQPQLADVAARLTYECLPSTSPAMASLDFAGKLQRWAAVKVAVDRT